MTRQRAERKEGSVKGEERRKTRKEGNAAQTANLLKASAVRTLAVSEFVPSSALPLDGTGSSRRRKMQ
jgi:hypothetical protein